MYLAKNKRKEILNLRKIMLLFFSGLLIVFVSSCKNENENESEKSHLSVRMTDAPGNFDAVMVDVQGVEVIGSNGNTVTLNTNNRIYNLLDLSNGVDTLIATGDLEPGKISQIRLILGTNNSVKIDGIMYAISAPSAMQSGLKLAVNKSFESGESYTILLDFDAGKSIVLDGDGSYKLKPVIRTIETAINGSIKGRISLTGFLVTVTASSKGETYTSVTNTKGQFLIAGLPAGTYDVTVTPDLPLDPVTKTGVEVTPGDSNNLGMIKI